MSCVHPLFAWKSYDNETKKASFRFLKGHIDKLELERNPNIVMIPCGQCVECRRQYAREWANRCLLESMYHESNYFITLTYDDFHLDTVLRDNGNLSLCPRDLELFWKRLRKGLDYKIRYFACGEYGDQTFRPHYHAIVFGLQLDDLVFYKRSPNGDIYYNSPFLSQFWDYGYAVVAPMTWETACYVAGYVQKKLTGEAKSHYAEFGIDPPFVRMSRKPGIGRLYYEDHKDDVESLSKISIPTLKGGRTFNVPRYYRKLFDKVEEEPLSEISLELLRTSDVFDSLDGARDRLLDQCDCSLDQYLDAIEIESKNNIKRRDVL